MVDTLSWFGAGLISTKETQKNMTHHAIQSRKHLIGKNHYFSVEYIYSKRLAE